MNTVSSRDGTTIAYDTAGEGPALILVDGALTVHSAGGKSELAGLLAPHFSVYGYDRRGRGGSGDTLPYAVDREIDDIEALQAANKFRFANLLRAWIEVDDAGAVTDCGYSGRGKPPGAIEKPGADALV